MSLSRRSFFVGLGASVLAAPAVIRIPGLLMPVSPVPVPVTGSWPFIDMLPIERIRVAAVSRRLSAEYTLVLPGYVLAMRTNTEEIR